jgi:hypothetical protein
MNTEKDSARYRREKKHLARLQTVLSQKRLGALKAPAKEANVSAPKARSTLRQSSAQASSGQAKKSASRSSK